MLGLSRTFHTQRHLRVMVRLVVCVAVGGGGIYTSRVIQSASLYCVCFPRL